MEDMQISDDAAVFHGEGAFWDDATRTLRHVDMLAGDIITLADRTTRSHVSDVVAVIRRRGAGGYVVAIERGFALLDDDLRLQRTIPAFDDPAVRMNEGACDSRGRFYCGSMAYEATPGAGTLYRLDPDLSVSVVREGVTIPNGLVWTRDDTVALHVETTEDRVLAYDFDIETGAFGEAETFADLSELDGSPDGAALDAEGGLWVAMWGGASVRRFDADGRLSDTIEVPASNVTSCAFGGPDGRTLYVTSSRDGLERDEELAGRVFSFDVGVAGATVHAFAG
jgi:sugar lactone lactonase YvrE